MVVIGLSTDEK